MCTVRRPVRAVCRSMRCVGRAHRHAARIRFSRGARETAGAGACREVGQRAVLADCLYLSQIAGSARGDGQWPGSAAPVNARTCCGTQEAIHRRSYTKKLYTQEAIPRSYTLVGPKKLHKCLHCSTKGTGGRPRAGKRHARPPRWRAWGTR